MCNHRKVDKKTNIIDTQKTHDSLQFGSNNMKVFLVTCKAKMMQYPKKPICITFIQRRPNVFDVGPALYKYYTKKCVVFPGIVEF